MTLATQMASDVTGLILNVSDFAEVILRDRGERNPPSITALVTWDREEDSTTNGRGDKLRGSVAVAAADCVVKMADLWVIEGRNYATTAINSPQYGMQTFRIASSSRDMQTGSREVV